MVPAPVERQQREGGWCEEMLAGAVESCRHADVWGRQIWAQQAKPGGTLRVALPGDLTFFNANQGPAPGYFTFWVWNNIFNSLLSLTPPPELKIVPDLAKSWEVLDEGRTYVFHLVEGVKFHDGTEFTAQVAKWNFERILDPDVKSWVRPYYEEIDKVEAVDQYTLRVQMKEPSGATDCPRRLLPGGAHGVTQIV